MQVVISLEAVVVWYTVYGTCTSKPGSAAEQRLSRLLLGALGGGPAVAVHLKGFSVQYNTCLVA